MSSACPDARPCQRLVFLGGDPRDLAGADAAGCIEGAARAARELQPPVPVDEQDVQDLVASERGAGPLDRLWEAEEQPFAALVGAVLVQKLPAVGVRVGVAKVWTPQDA